MAGFDPATTLSHGVSSTTMLQPLPSYVRQLVLGNTVPWSDIIECSEQNLIRARDIVCHRNNSRLTISWRTQSIKTLSIVQILRRQIFESQSTNRYFFQKKNKFLSFRVNSQLSRLVSFFPSDAWLLFMRELTQQQRRWWLEKLFQTSCIIFFQICAYLACFAPGHTGR